MMYVSTKGTQEPSPGDLGAVSPGYNWGRVNMGAPVKFTLTVDACDGSTAQKIIAGWFPRAPTLRKGTAF
jgi:hypothetical protein